MPRPKRINIPGIPQHLVQRGNNRQDCFLDKADYRLYLDLLRVACNRHACAVHAFVLMTNHVHILLTPQIAEGASLVFRELGRDYVRQFNKRYGRTGTLWEARFKSSLVDSNECILACYRYIELNPVRAGMVSNPSDYPWSSHRANALGESSNLLIPHDTWLALGKDDTSRRQVYRSLFDFELDPHQNQVITSGLNKGLPTGDDSFKERLQKFVPCHSDMESGAGHGYSSEKMYPAPRASINRFFAEPVRLGFGPSITPTSIVIASFNKHYKS